LPCYVVELTEIFKALFFIKCCLCLVVVMCIQLTETMKIPQHMVMVCDTLMLPTGLFMLCVFILLVLFYVNLPLLHYLY